MSPAIIEIVLLVVITSAVGQQKPPGSGVTSSHFRWSERTAHELDYRHTIRTANNLAAEQKKVLLDAVLTQLKRARSTNEQMFEGISERQLRKMAADTRIELVDLNGDGQPEVIAQANGLGACGGTGNCIVWIFQMTSDGTKLLLDTTSQKWVGGFEVLSIRLTSTNGFRDIVLGSHGSASERTLVAYRYAKDRYQQSACYYANWMSTTLERLKSPEISPCNEAPATRSSAPALALRAARGSEFNWAIEIEKVCNRPLSVRLTSATRTRRWHRSTHFGLLAYSISRRQRLATISVIAPIFLRAFMSPICAIPPPSADPAK